MNNAISKITDKLNSWLDSIVTMLPNFVVAILVLVLFYFLAKMQVNMNKKN